MKLRVKIKPLSVNECWQGRRFKTAAYKAYEKELLYILPTLSVPKPPYRVTYEFGMSNVQSDYDNPIKPLQDILQKKYGLNDSHIYEAIIRKVKVEKGADYLTVQIESI